MKTILHLCADLGSDSYPYQCDENYRVIRIGKDYGVENVTREKLWHDFGVSRVHGIVAKPALPFQRKSAIRYILEFAPFVNYVKTDADLRSLCSQHFALSFKEANP